MVTIQMQSHSPNSLIHLISWTPNNTTELTLEDEGKGLVQGHCGGGGCVYEGSLRGILYVLLVPVLHNPAKTVTGIVTQVDCAAKRTFQIVTSFGGSGFIKYKLTDDIKLNLLVQATERKELKWAYGGNNVIKFSGFIGVEFNLN